MDKTVFRSECGCWFTVDAMSEEEFMITNIEIVTICSTHKQKVDKFSKYNMINNYDRYIGDE